MGLEEQEPAEFFDEESLLRRFPALAPLLEQPGFVACRWASCDASGMQVTSIMLES